MSKVITRVAPSPTGNLHIGTARSALFNYLYARKYSGTYIVRLEDTDKARSKKEYEENILEGLSWLGLAHDALYKQSERTELYTSYIEQLIKEEKAYLSKEESKQEEGKMVEVVRLKNPGTSITFTDLIRGEISFDTAELGDLVIARAIDDPLYHLTVVVDDHEMGVTHVIRGEDHISNTPRQILIQEALGFKRPEYAHIPLILAPDRSKMSKRNGAVSIAAYKEEGYLPEALLNYLALLGWNPGTEQELFTLEELVEHFDLTKVQKGGAVFNKEKLDWFNQAHLKRRRKEANLSDIQRAVSAELYKVLSRSPAAYEDTMERLSRIPLLTQLEQAGEYRFYTQAPNYERELLLFKGKIEPAEALLHLNHTSELLSALAPENFDNDQVREVLWPYAEERGKGNVLWPLRAALSGKERSPDPFTLAEALGKDETRKRIEHAVTLLS